MDREDAKFKVGHSGLMTEAEVNAYLEKVAKDLTAALKRQGILR